MVANALQDAPPKAKLAKRKPGTRGPEIPVLVKLQARSLYLNECLSHRAIADQTGLPIRTVQQLAHKESWTSARRFQKEKLYAAQDAKGDALRKQVEESLAERAIILGQKALNVTESGLDQGDLDGAKQAQAASSALKNLITTARVLQNPGLLTDAASGSGTILNVFIQRTPGKEEAKPVQEIEAKRVQ